MLAAMYASQGYAVVATDYLGYAKSSHIYHPYLHADSEATSVIDSIRAARNAVASQGASLNGKVVMTAEWGPAVSKNPFLQFTIKGAKAGDKVGVVWKDNKSDTRSDEATVS